MDMYGISNSIMEENTLHGKMEQERILRQQTFNLETQKFQKAQTDARGRDTTTNEEDIAGNVSDIQKVINVGSGLGKGAKGAIAGAKGAVGARIAEQGASDSGLLSVTDLNPVGVTATGEALNDTGSLSRGASTLSSALAEGARTTGTALSGGARGFIAGADEAFGGSSLPSAGTFQALKTAEAGGEGLTGIEGIVQKGLVKAGGGETLGVVGGKAFGAIGGLVDAGGDINSLIKTGGKSMYTRVDSATGKRVEDSGVDKAGDILTEAGSALDVASAFTGGLLVPLASAVTLAGAGLSAVGSIEDEKSDDKEVGINSDGTTDASKAPKLNGGPISNAYASLGFIGNMSHNPLSHI